jgi:hypothetical protein
VRSFFNFLFLLPFEDLPFPLGIALGANDGKLLGIKDGALDGALVGALN